MARQRSTKAKGWRAAIAAPMTGRQYQAALAELGISNYAFAPLIGIALRTAQHYAGDERRIPGPMAALLRLLIKHPRLKAELFPPAG
jgi:DNA-binding transcriptional regulator YiaG